MALLVVCFVSGICFQVVQAKINHCSLCIWTVKFVKLSSQSEKYIPPLM